MNVKHLLFSLILILSAELKSYSQSPCSADPAYHLLDFLIGEWDVYNSEDEMTGTNSFKKILKDCAVTEEWMGSTGSKGFSLFYFDNTSKGWRQVWVTEDALKPYGQKNKTLIHYIKDSILVFEGKYKMENQLILDRTILKKVSQNHFTQTIQISSDGGMTWRNIFIGDYKRKKDNH